MLREENILISHGSSTVLLFNFLILMLRYFERFSAIPSFILLAGKKGKTQPSTMRFIYRAMYFNFIDSTK